jgi:predicted RNA binding protein YcfA (HicA-like mRNA interferase family)
VQNVRFRDLVRLAEAVGFVLARREGSHHAFSHPEVQELLNLQEVLGEAKPYQVRQLLRLIERYNLNLRDAS